MQQWNLSSFKGITGVSPQWWPNMTLTRQGSARGPSKLQVHWSGSWTCQPCHHRDDKHQDIDGLGQEKVQDAPVSFCFRELRPRHQAGPGMPWQIARQDETEWVWTCNWLLKSGKIHQTRGAAKLYSLLWKVPPAIQGSNWKNLKSTTRSFIRHAGPTKIWQSMRLAQKPEAIERARWLGPARHMFFSRSNRLT